MEFQVCWSKIIEKTKKIYARSHSKYYFLLRSIIFGKKFYYTLNQYECLNSKDLFIKIRTTKVVKFLLIWFEFLWISLYISLSVGHFTTISSHFLPTTLWYGNFDNPKKKLNDRTVTSLKIPTLPCCFHPLHFVFNKQLYWVASY